MARVRPRIVTGRIADDLSNWDASHRLALGNELTGDRPWLGNLYYVAVYDRPLDAEEVPARCSTGWNAGLK